MSIFSKLFKKAPEKQQAWMRKKCKSCAKYGQPTCPEYKIKNDSWIVHTTPNSSACAKYIKRK